MKRSIALIGILLAVFAANAQENALPKYKGCHQLTRYDSTFVTVAQSGLSRVVNHQRILMLDAEGCKANSVVTLDYDPQSAYVDFFEVLVHRADGRTDTILYGNGPSQVYDYVAPARLIYWGASQKMVEVGHLDVNDELEFSTFRKGFTYALLFSPDDDSRYVPPMKGHFYDIVPFWAAQPVQHKVYTLLVPSSKDLRYEVYNDPQGRVSCSQQNVGSQTEFTFSCADIMPLAAEPAMLANNDVQPKLLLSTAPNWMAKSVWFYNVNEDYGSFRSTPELVQKVKELLAPAKSESDSISILTHWVADNMRYCGISMGQGEGYTLHNAQMNLTDRCGVCKDKAGLLVAMLRAAGFKAYAAMTMAHERIDLIPADQFNHSVCAVQQRDGRFELLDPTWVPNVRELWSSAEQQQGYLIGAPQGFDLMYTPLSKAENHYIRIRANSKIHRNGTLSGTISITAEGQSDKAVRGVFSCRQAEWQANLEKELLKIDPRAVIKSVKHTDNDRYLQQPVTITYKFSIPNYAVVDGDNLIFIPISARNFFSRAMGHLDFDESVQTRQYPFADQCSRLVEIQEQVSLPYQYSKLSFAPEVRGVVNPAVNYGCSYWLNGTTLSFGESAMFNKRIYNADDWPAFREAVKYQKALAVNPVVLTR